MYISDVKNMFPALKRQVYGKRLVYLDNAATSQKPESVLALYDELSRKSNGNIHRAMHLLSNEATTAYEAARDRVASFINAPAREEVIFTSGATAAINLVASSFGRAFLKSGDKVMVTEAEHHSNIVPWQLACKYAGAELAVLPVSERGEIDLGIYEEMLDEGVKIVAAAHISNVLGVVNPVKEMVRMAHERSIPVLIDGAQGIVHSKVDVRDLDCDFYVFSGHKIYAPTGTGILYGKRKYLDIMPPYMGGGDMVGTVSFRGTTYAELPLKFEAGTPNFTAQACLLPALDFADMLRSDEELGAMISSVEKEIVEYVSEGLEQMEGVTLFGRGAEDRSNKIPLFSISVDGVHPSDIAQIMDKMGIALRSGMMCAEPLLTALGVTSVLRASFLPYNDMEDARTFMTGLQKALDMLKN